MKITESYWKENSDDKRANRQSRAAEAGRLRHVDEANAAAKAKHSEPPINEDLKFAGILKSMTDPPKLKQTEDDAGEQRRDDDKKDKKRADGQKDSTENSVNADRVERFKHSGGGQFGGGFGAGGSVGQREILSENFAARSILHIADLERMISVVRKQISLGGKREITLELKRSLLEGLKVKITTGDAAQTEIEFLAANDKIRSQIENRSEELAEILRGRGINLQSLTATLDFGDYKDSSSAGNVEKQSLSPSEKSVEEKSQNDLIDENTFSPKTENDSHQYRA